MTDRPDLKPDVAARLEDVDEVLGAHPVELVGPTAAGLADELPEHLRAELIDAVESYAAAAQAPNTTRAYNQSLS